MLAISLMLRPGEDLVAEDDLRLKGQTPGQLQPFEIAGRQGRGQLVGHKGVPLETDLLQDVDAHRVPVPQLSTASPAAGPLGPRRKERNDQVLVRRQAVIGPHDLKGPGHPQVRDLVGGFPVMSLPRKKIFPDVMSMKPVMQLTRVVLPEPLGPMIPRISPSCTSKSSPGSAPGCRRRSWSPLRHRSMELGHIFTHLSNW